MQDDFAQASEQGSLTRSTIHGVFWITATRAIKVPLNLLSIAVLARLLTATDFGIVAIGAVIVSLSNVLVDGSFGMVLIQRHKLDSRLIGASVALSSGLAVLFAIAVMAAAPSIEKAFAFPELGTVLLVLGAVLPVTAVTMITTALLQRDFQFSVLTRNALGSQLTYTGLAIGLALAGMGLWSLVWAQVASFIVEALLGFLAVRKRYSIRFSASGIRDVWKMGGMFTVSRLLNWGAYSVDSIIIGRFVGAADLGFYSRALALTTTVRQLTGTGPMRVLFPSFSKIQHDPARMAKGYLRALSVTLILATLISLFIIVNADIIVRILLGPHWQPTIALIQILFAAFAARTGYIVAESVPLALGLSGQSALRQGAQVLLVSIGAGVGAQFGVFWATVGVAIAYWIFYFICLLLVQQLLPLRWGEIFRLHFNGLLLAIPPAGAALAVRPLISNGNLFLQLIPPTVFCATAAVVLVISPAALVSDDIVRARNMVWRRLAPYLGVLQLHR
jgi:PST family polysaccharide transporter